MPNRVKWSDRTVVNQLNTFDARMDRALTAAVSYHAVQAERYAKQNAPWTDRTTNARNGLYATSERDRPRYRIIIGHSVSYGIWLEIRFNGRFRIIVPTLDHEGPEVMKTVEALYAKIFKV